MEKNEKTQEVPAWVKTIQDFPDVVQQSLGNLCAQCVQNLSMVALVSAELFVNVCKEVVTHMNTTIQADFLVKDLVNDALKDDKDL